MDLVFSPQAREDYQRWPQNDRKLVKRRYELVRDTERNPYSGIGKGMSRKVETRFVFGSIGISVSDLFHHLGNRRGKAAQTPLNCGGDSARAGVTKVAMRRSPH